jgi:hypothetical protein
MQTHYDQQHAFIDRLRERAEKAQKAAASTIAAGGENEQELGSWRASNGMHCRHMPDDEQGILRLSIGGGEHLPTTMNYLVVRGKIGQCIELLEKALVALRQCPE